MRALLPLVLLVLFAMAAMAAIQVPQTPPPTTYSLNVNALGNLSFTQPVCMTTPPGDTRQLYICERGGRILRIPDVTAANPQSEVFLDLSAVLAGRREHLETQGECGLVGLAFHPQYNSQADKRFFYVFYSVRKGRVNYQRVSRFSTASGQPELADPASEFVLIQQRDAEYWHQAGDMHFGNDGYLYISLGDEGGSNDTYRNSQRIHRDFFSGVLRIDVDKKPGNLAPTKHRAVVRDNGVARYAIPIDNPFVPVVRGGTWDGRFNGRKVYSTHVRSEFWAVGLRNPWRMSFDSETGDLWLADVGQGAREEINLITRGGNYGWNYREGTIQRPGSRKAPPAGFSAIDPIYEYGRGSGELHGNCVIGGGVYRGSNIAALQGAYVFGDYGAGHIWALRRTPEITVERLTGGSGIVAFGRDPSNGDILVANIHSGVIQRLVTLQDPTYPATLSATGLFTDLANLTPAPPLRPYQVNVPFWSDHAEKQRWAYMPPSSSMMWSRDGLWTFPDGMIWVKHFEIDLTRHDASTRKRLETRLLVKNSDGAYGVSYRWNDAGTEATLVADAGETLPLEISEDGMTRTQSWRIPSRAQCMHCHTPQAGYALSFNTRQLNCEGAMFSLSGNQLTAMDEQGWFSNAIEAPNTLPRHVRADESGYALEARVRSYLAVNCAQCHRPNGSALPAFWDARPEIPLDDMHLVHEPPYNNGGVATNRLVAPGDPEHSVLLSRIIGSHGFKRMPPLGSSEIDTANAALVAAWIRDELPAGSLAHSAIPQEHQALAWSPMPAASAPTAGESHALTLARANPHELRLSVTAPAQRAFQIEVSNDLQQWSPLDVPGNHGIQRHAGVFEWTLPCTETNRFYRARIWKP